jgi:hypothetical protein
VSKLSKNNQNVDPSFQNSLNSWGDKNNSNLMNSFGVGINNENPMPNNLIVSFGLAGKENVGEFLSLINAWESAGIRDVLKHFNFFSWLISYCCRKISIA